MKKCPNCGACQECGHAPIPWNPYPVYPWQQPYYPYGTQPIWISPQPVTWGSGGVYTSGSTSSTGTYTVWNSTGDGPGEAGALAPIH